MNYGILFYHLTSIENDLKEALINEVNEESMTYYQTYLSVLEEQ
jgi:hypothetical protein